MKKKNRAHLIKDLIELYELRIKAKRGLVRIHGPQKAEGILFELAYVIRDLKDIL